MTNSKRKGKDGELEIVKILKDHGYDVRRSVQYNGAAEDGQADVIGLSGIHIEVKRVEKLNIYEAVSQAIRDCDLLHMPAVFHRRNNRPWLVTMPLENWLTVYRLSQKALDDFERYVTEGDNVEE